MNSGGIQHRQNPTEQLPLQELHSKHKSLNRTIKHRLFSEQKSCVLCNCSRKENGQRNAEVSKCFYTLFRYHPRILAATQFTTMDREGKVAARRELTNGTGHGA